jgi:small conductance mechanosensitive channel
VQAQSGWFSDDMQRIWIPVIAAGGAVAARALIHYYASRWMKRADTEQEARLVRSIESSSTPLLFLIALYLVLFSLPLDSKWIGTLQLVLAVTAIAVAVWAVSRILSIAAELWKARKPGMQAYIQPLRNLFTGITLLIGVGVTLKVLALDDVSGQGQRVIRMAGIMLGGYFAIKIVQIVIAKIESIVSSHDVTRAAESSRRAKTLGRVLNNLAWAVVVGIGATMVLSEFGIPVMGIVASAGIAGIALGLGAQNLVRDVIGGFFLILENQVRVGDVAIINGTGGSVEAINLRTIVLRDLRGAVHVFPNGGISHVSNLTKEWSRCVVDLPVSHEENIDRVLAILAEVGEELYADAALRPLILEKLEVLGVEDIGDVLITVRVAVKTLPLKQWIVARELRRKIKVRFDREGIKTFAKTESSVRRERSRKGTGGEPVQDNDPLAG